MSIYRTKKARNFTTVGNEFINDPNLTAKAKGILLYLLSKPDDWETRTEDIVAHMADGLDSIKSGIKELTARGYMLRRQLHNEAGKFSGWETLVFETPMPLVENPPTAKSKKRKSPKVEKPLTEKPLVEKPLTENPPLLNTDQPNTDLKQNTDQPNTDFSCAFAQEAESQPEVVEVFSEPADQPWSTEQHQNSIPDQPKDVAEDQSSAAAIAGSKKQKSPKLKPEQVDWLLQQYLKLKPANWCGIDLNPKTKAYSDRCKLLNALYAEHGDELGRLWREVLNWLPSDKFWGQEAEGPGFEALARPVNFSRLLEKMDRANAAISAPSFDAENRRLAESFQRSMAAIADL